MSVPPTTRDRIHRPLRAIAAVLACVCIVSIPATAQANGYRQPPDDVVAVLSAPRPPLISVAVDGRHALLLDPEVYTRLEDLARPAMAVNGRKLDPDSHAPRDVVHYSGLSFLDLDTGNIERIALDENVRIG